MSPLVLKTAFDRFDDFHSAAFGKQHSSARFHEIFVRIEGSPVQRRQHGHVHDRNTEHLHEVETERLRRRSWAMVKGDARVEPDGDDRGYGLPVKHSVSEAEQGVEAIGRWAAIATVKPKSGVEVRADQIGQGTKVLPRGAPFDTEECLCVLDESDRAHALPQVPECSFDTIRPRLLSRRPQQKAELTRDLRPNEALRKSERGPRVRQRPKLPQMPLSALGRRRQRPDQTSAESHPVHGNVLVRA
jgi:hypothetical protein